MIDLGQLRHLVAVAEHGNRSLAHVRDTNAPVDTATGKLNAPIRPETRQAAAATKRMRRPWRATSSSPKSH
ncbi:MAG: hypothetical protein MZW92_26095 [Comamonadaceae bacterium]|nr:hypothetical protein [Comamonadaceae bacterium]